MLGLQPKNSSFEISPLPIPTIADDDLSVGLPKLVAVHVEKDEHGGRGRALVRVKERLGLGDEVGISSSLLGYGWIRILAERGLFGLTSNRRELRRGPQACRAAVTLRAPLDAGQNLFLRRICTMTPSQRARI